jgi:hypothetical protein
MFFKLATGSINFAESAVGRDYVNFGERRSVNMAKAIKAGQFPSNGIALPIFFMQF